MYRQGDILFVPVESIFYDLNQKGFESGRRNGGIIVAAGEATGHHHRVLDKNARRWHSNGGKEILHAKGTITVTHEEHEALVLPEGTYEIVRQREYVAPRPQERQRPRWTYVRD